MKTNKFITFEAVDGAEKSVHIDLLAERLRSSGKKVVVTSEPRGTEFGRNVHMLMQVSDLDDTSSALLMHAVRHNHTKTVIKPALDDGAWVLCDRYVDSTTAFQYNSSIPSGLSTNIQPDVTFYFDVSIETLSARIPDNDHALPGLLSKLEAVKSMYKVLAQKYSDRIIVIDGEQDADKIIRQIDTALHRLGRVVPTVTLYDKGEFGRLVENSKDKSESSERIARVLAKMQKAGSSTRALCTLPEDWSSIVDEFARDFPNFGEFADFLRDQFSLSSLGDGRLALPPVLFLGEAGVGKTEVSLWWADKLSVEHRVLDMASAQSNATLAGSDAYWDNTREGSVFEAIAYGEYANPIFVLEELDKIESGTKYNPSSPLYSLLEKRTASRFMDLSVRDLHLDASHIVWFATANNKDLIPSPIVKRFSTFNIPMPNQEQILVIANSIYRRMLRSNAWGALFPSSLSNDVLDRIGQKRFAPRDLVQVLNSAFGVAARAHRTEIIADDIRFKAENKRQIGF